MRALVHHIARAYGCPTEQAAHLVLAVHEACVNVIRHAYGGCVNREIVLQILDADNELVFRIIDSAEPVDQSKLKARSPNELRPGGLGLHIIDHVMDTMELSHRPEGAGNILEMRKHLAHTEARSAHREGQ